MESFADGADVSNANEFDDETIKEEQVKDDMKNNSLADSEPPVDYQTQNKMDAANSQENNYFFLLYAIYGRKVTRNL